MNSELMHVRRLKEGDVIIRRDAAKVLGYLNSASGGRAIQPLIEALNDKDMMVKYNVIQSLIRIGDNQAVEPLINLIKDKDEESIIRKNAAQALGELGDNQAVEPLINLIKDKDYESKIRNYAVKALGKHGDNQAVEPLIKLGKDEIDFSRSVIYSLIDLADDHYMKMGEPETHDTWWDEWEKFEQLILFKHHYLKLIEKLESYWKI